LSTKECLFCGGTTEGRSRAREHILSQDLLREFSLARELMQHSQVRTVDGDFSGGHVSIFPTTRSLTYSGFVAGHVCGNCNSGWMNRLEIAVRPYLYPLMRGELEPRALMPQQRELLASWYLKTTVALSQSIDAPQFFVPLDHARRLARSAGKRLPERIAVFATTTSTSAIRWSLCPTWMVTAEEGVSHDRMIEQHADTYKVFMQLGNLMMLACHWPNPSAAYSVGSSSIIPVGGLAFDAYWDKEYNEDLFRDESERFMMAVGVLLKR
jgi:hypothetical protein